MAKIKEIRILEPKVKEVKQEKKKEDLEEDEESEDDLEEMVGMPPQNFSQGSPRLNTRNLFLRSGLVQTNGADFDDLEDSVRDVPIQEEKKKSPDELYANAAKQYEGAQSGSSNGTGITRPTNDSLNSAGTSFAQGINSRDPGIRMLAPDVQMSSSASQEGRVAYSVNAEMKSERNAWEGESEAKKYKFNPQ